MYTTYLRQDKKIGMYVDFGVLCTRYLISGWDFPRILFWKRSNLAKKVSNFRPSQYPAIESWTSFTYKIRKGLLRIATSSTSARYSHCICTEIHNSIETFCHFCMFPKIKRYIVHSISNPEAKKNNLIRMPLALSLYQMRIFPQKTST